LTNARARVSAADVEASKEPGEEGEEPEDELGGLDLNGPRYCFPPNPKPVPPRGIWPRERKRERSGQPIMI
jgi:hypothetical protein